MNRTSKHEAFVCRHDELSKGKVVVLSLGRDAAGLPFQVLVLRDGNGAVRAYRNLCKHLPVPLDGGTRDFRTDDQRHIICRTHGALYRIDDGYCTEGPCAGTSLKRVHTEERGAELWVWRNQEKTPRGTP